MHEEKSKVRTFESAVRRKLGVVAYFCKTIWILFVPAYVIVGIYVIIGALLMSGGLMDISQFFIGVAIVVGAAVIETILYVLTYYDVALVGVIPPHSNTPFVVATFRVQDPLVGQRYIKLEIDRRDIDYYVRHEAFHNPYEIH